MSSGFDSVLSEHLRQEETPELASRILQAAMALFARKGYAATSVREIVQQANVTNPMLYYYFSSKEGVFTKLIDLLFAARMAELERVLLAHERLYDRLDAVMSFHLRGCREAPLALRFMYTAIFGPREGRPDFDLFERQRAGLESMEQIFAQAVARGELRLREGMTPSFLAQQFFGYLNNHLLVTLTMLEQAPDEETRDWLRETLLGEHPKSMMLSLFFRGAGLLEEQQG